MKKSRIEWILGEVTRLNNDAVIDDTVANTLRNHYTPMLANTRSTAAIVAITLFSCLGALLIGGGIILIFGYNWGEFPRYARAIVSGSMPVVALMLAFYVILEDKSRSWREAAGVFVFLSAISSLALISQTYYLGGSINAFLFVVLIMALPVPLMLRSMAAMVLYLATIVSWYFATMEIYRDAELLDGIMFFVFPAIALNYFLLTYRGKSRNEKVLDAYVIAIFIAFMIPTAFGFFHAKCTPITFLAPAAIMFCLGRIASRSKKDLNAMALPFMLLGFAVIIVTSILMQIAEVNREILDVDAFKVDFIFGIVALATAIYGFCKRSIFGSLLCCLPLLFTGLSIAAERYSVAREGHITAIAISIIIAAICVVGLIEGVKRFSLSTVNLSCVLLLSAILVRFFDGEFSMLIRGVSFVISGFVFLAVNLAMVKYRKRQLKGVSDVN